MSQCPDSEVIYGTTPLENDWYQVHPRLYLSAAKLEALRLRLGDEPYAGFFKRLQECAGRKEMPHAALAFLLTDDRTHLDHAITWIGGQLDGTGRAGWDATHTVAILYDWLHHHLPEELLARMRAYLTEVGQECNRQFAMNEVYGAGVYGWNISMHGFMKSAVPAFALYGDVPGLAPWVRSVMEKIRVITHALGPDGASPEGINYGGGFSEFYLYVAALVRDLGGWDPLALSPHFRNFAAFHLFSLLPAKAIRSGRTHLCFGDGAQWFWCGPDFMLRLLAGAYGDPVAQKAADLTTGADISAAGGTFFNLLWHDSAVKPAASVESLGLTHHFEDKGLVMMRSGWDGDESVAGILCGPPGGWHALAHYPQCVGGGHMTPSAGGFQIFAHGEPLLYAAEYAFKQTDFHNAALVNGQSQLGSGGDWFECTEYRRTKRGPRVLSVREQDSATVVSCEVAPAYPDGLGIRRYDRHFIYLRPDVWVVVDDFSTRKPSTFDILFHAHDAPHAADRTFTPCGEHMWETGGEKGRMRLTCLTPVMQGVAELQSVWGTGKKDDGVHPNHQEGLLRLRNAAAARTLTSVVVMEAFAAGRAPTASATWDGRELVVKQGAQAWSLVRRGRGFRAAHVQCPA